MAETPYVETEILLAVLNGDRDEADRLLREMTPNERQEFALKVCQLDMLVDDRYRCPGCGSTTVGQSPLYFSGGSGTTRQAWHKPCHDAELD